MRGGGTTWPAFSFSSIRASFKIRFHLEVGRGVSTLQDPPSKNLRVGHPPRRFNFNLHYLWAHVGLHSTLKGFEDFDFAFFAEDVYGDACGVAVDDYVAVCAGDS